MPMLESPVRDYGLLLYDDEIEALGIDEDDLSNYSDVDGDFQPLNEESETISFHEDRFFILPLQNEPTLFSQAYSNYEDARAEIVLKLGEHKELPFNIDDRLGVLNGITFG